MSQIIYFQRILSIRVDHLFGSREMQTCDVRSQSMRLPWPYPDEARCCMRLSLPRARTHVLADYSLWFKDNPLERNEVGSTNVGKACKDKCIQGL